MRSGLHDADFIEESGEVIGVNFGWDFCSEHEWGIKDLCCNFGIDSEIRKDNLGFLNRKITVFPAKNLHILKDKNKTILVYQKHYGTMPDFKYFKRQILRDNCGWKEGIACAWSEKDFGILVTSKKDREHLYILYNSFKEKDITIFCASNSNPFSNSGLTIVLYSKIPKEACRAAKEADHDYLQLLKASDKTKIIKKLDKSISKDTSSFYKKNGYYACSPRWISNELSEKSKHPVMYWLNPQDQQGNNSGWYTVEELEQWIEGE